MYGSNPGGTKTKATAVVEHILQKEKVRSALKQQRLEELQKLKTDDDEATFKPQTNKYPMAM